MYVRRPEIPWITQLGQNAFLVGVQIFSEYSDFLPQSKDVHIRQIEDPKLPLETNAWVNGVRAPCDGLVNCQSGVLMPLTLLMGEAPAPPNDHGQE